MKAQETKLNTFLKNLPDDAKLEMFIGVTTDKGSNPQLARIHAMIRQLANDIGYTFEEIKLQVKRTAGLCFTRNNTEYCKSFADCVRTSVVPGKWKKKICKNLFKQGAQNSGKS